MKLFELKQCSIKTQKETKKFCVLMNSGELVQVGSKKACLFIIQNTQEKTNDISSDVQSESTVQSSESSSEVSTPRDVGVREYTPDRQDYQFIEEYREGKRRGDVATRKLFGQLEQLRRFELSCRQTQMGITPARPQAKLEQETISVESFEVQ